MRDLLVIRSTVLKEAEIPQFLSLFFMFSAEGDEKDVS